MEDRSDPCAAFDLAVDELESVNGAELSVEVPGEGIDGETLLDLLFEKSTPFGSDFGIGGNCGVELLPSILLGTAAEDIFKRLPEFLFQILFGNIALCILSEMELTTLPRNVWKDSCPGGSHPSVVIAYNERHPVEPPLKEQLEEFPLMNLRFRE